MKSVYVLATAFVFLLVALEFSDAWSGHFKKVRQSTTTSISYCACWYWWWGCSYWRSYWITTYSYRYQCNPGWTHNGDQNCNIPICRPSCKNGGDCTSPNVCKCPSTAIGPFCAALTCSYQQPCYPGDCTSGTDCTCEPGFIKSGAADGCITFDSTHEELRPIVGKSNVTLSNIRRTDNRVNFMFVLEGLEEKTPGQLVIIWSNQKRFNNLQFEYESYFKPPENLPERPIYVHESEIGIVESIIEANVSKVARSGSPIRDPGSFKSYKCESGFSKDNPEAELAVCVIDDDQFKTLIEHGDWLNIKFKSASGGFQKLVNIDQRSKPYATKYYNGLQDTREVQFNFDFIAPKHCSEAGAFVACPSDPSILRILNEFTKDPIEMYWSGWTDDLAGVWEYYVEVFKLSPDPYNRLIEMEALSPVFNTTVPHRTTIAYPKYRPTQPGMYSVLMETRDIANNSRIARRLVLYDDRSEITLSNKTDGQLYVNSAVKETGYMWQTAGTGQSVRIDVIWQNHFVNTIIADNKLLNAVEPYPIQFKEIQDDGVLFSQKFVQDSLDDHTGDRTRDAIINYHGIVKFEAAKVLTLDDTEPTVGWTTVSPFEEKTTFKEKLADGSRVRIWVRATDAMGNIKSDSTLVTFDGTPPKISKPGTTGAMHSFTPNIKNATYNYTSRIQFTASDAQSGVHKIGYAITIKTTNKEDRVVYENFSSSSMDTTDNPLCNTIEGKCFIPQQSLDLDNCWFMIGKSDLDTSTAFVEVTAYNQALLTASTVFQVGPVKNLQGLEKYNGPENMRIEKPSSAGFRIAWDLPEKSSCYGRAEIVIVLFRKKAIDKIELETYYASGTSKYFDILGLDAETDYEIALGIRLPTSSAVQSTGIALDAKTTADITETTNNTGLIVGVVVGVLGFVALVAVIVLIRRGIIHPGQRVQTVQRAVSKRVRKSHVEFPAGERRPVTSKAAKYDNRQSELYIYGGMDMSAPQIWHINRNEVVFESLLKNGHFANIYKAKLKTGSQSRDYVVAKTLKESFTPEDELLMKAKINFSGEKVGEHPNVLKFIGAVVTDDTMGPFIIYEYCENGTLRDYVADRQHNVTIDLQENLFRFGLDIAKGMEYLAAKGIVHRRLACRNILLNFLNEVKISGFGPQPSEEDGGDAEKGKKERIPIKWVAPECMESTKDATEQSDVWSYAVVLWEMFSLGETPYSGKGTDLPSRLKKGERLAKPEQCDDTPQVAGTFMEILRRKLLFPFVVLSLVFVCSTWLNKWYAEMKKCWSYEARKRPKFAKIREELDNLFVASPGDDYYFYKR